MTNGFWDGDDYEDHDLQSDTDYDTDDIEDEDSEDDDNEDYDDDDRGYGEKDEDKEEDAEDNDMEENSDVHSSQSIIKQKSSHSPSFHGYGKCMRYLCNCQHFESISGNTCSNCGHNYSDHW